MLELLFGMLVGVGIGTYNHEKTEPCMAPLVEELIAFKDKLQGRMEAGRTSAVTAATSAAARRQ